MNEMINKVAQDHMDSKFEDALNEVAASIDQYISMVNDTSSKQYDDFNTKIREGFGKNMQQVQDVVKTLHDELEIAKGKVTQLEKDINEVDITAKKGVEQVKDQMEVERCVVEMVSWVSEQLSN